MTSETGDAWQLPGSALLSCWVVSRPPLAFHCPLKKLSRNDLGSGAIAISQFRHW